jgi:hypothetical protein
LLLLAAVLPLQAETQIPRCAGDDNFKNFCGQTSQSQDRKSESKARIDGYKADPPIAIVAPARIKSSIAPPLLGLLVLQCSTRSLSVRTIE